MPLQDPDAGYVRTAVLVMLSLALLAAVCATAIHWLNPAHRPLDLIVPPTMSAVFGGLIVVVLRRPQRTLAIARIALLAAAMALVAPAWLYTLQATFAPGVRLIDTLPPVSSLFVVLVVMLAIFIPGRRGVFAALLGWALIALPVLVYLFVHPREMLTPRGQDLLMAYGPAVVLAMVVLPVQRGMSAMIRGLASERAHMETMLRRDPLTGVQSRRYGERALKTLLSAQVPGGVIMLDVDRFKSINDTHGHPFGDRVLQAIAECCDGLLHGDECLARWGGEEFLVVVPRIDAPGLLRMAERMQDAVERLPVAPARQVTASFGAVAVGLSDSLETVLHRVDRALYRAKAQGGNRVVLAGENEASADPILATREGEA